MRLREQGDRRGVGEHIGQALGRIIRIQRHIAGAGLEDGQQADHHVDTALEADGDPFVRLHAEGDQAVRQLVGALVQLSITELFTFDDEGDGVGLLRRLLFEGLVDQALGRIVGGGVVEAVQQLVALVQRQLTGRSGLSIPCRRPESTVPNTRSSRAVHFARTWAHAV
jgi:hypothetical protein